MSAFSTVHVKFFIQTTLVKTQRLSIRIYSDRKNNYFYSNVHIKQKKLHLMNCVIYKSVLNDKQFFI